jgi:hypothetical protein
LKDGPIFSEPFRFHLEAGHLKHSPEEGHSAPPGQYIGAKDLSPSEKRDDVAEVVLRLARRDRIQPLQGLYGMSYCGAAAPTVNSGLQFLDLLGAQLAHRSLGNHDKLAREVGVGLHQQYNGARADAFKE